MLNRTRRRPIAAFGWLATVVVLVVAVFGQSASGGVGAAPARQDDPAAQATAIREAELRELAELRVELGALQTQVAEPCLPPTPTMVPTPAAPAPSGQPVAHSGDWTFVVIGATARPTVAEMQAKGVFMEVALIVTNDGTAARAMPLSSLVLQDDQGRQFSIDTFATTKLDAYWIVPIDPGQPEEVRVAFDVAVDSGQAFVLESTSDPGFRVEVGSVPRG